MKQWIILISLPILLSTHIRFALQEKEEVPEGGIGGTGLTVDKIIYGNKPDVKLQEPSKPKILNKRTRSIIKTQQPKSSTEDGASQPTKENSQRK